MYMIGAWIGPRAAGPGPDLTWDWPRAALWQHPRSVLAQAQVLDGLMHMRTSKNDIIFLDNQIIINNKIDIINNRELFFAK